MLEIYGMKSNASSHSGRVVYALITKVEIYVCISHATVGFKVT